MQGFLKITLVSFAVLTCAALFAQEGNAGDTIIVATKAKANKGVTVSGSIKDAATGKPLPAINISIPDFSAALTDDNGNFSIKVPDYHATLFITAEGFQSKEIALKGRRTVSALLYEETFNSMYDNVTTPS